MNTNINQIQWRKTTQFSSIWVINMQCILYFMSEIWNNTVIIDLPKSKYFTHICIHQIFRLSYSQSKICSLHATCPLTDSFKISKLIPSFLCIRNIKMIILAIHDLLLAFTAIVFLSLNYLKFINKKQNPSILETLIGWPKLLMYLTETFTWKGRNEYFIFQFLHYPSKIEIWHNISDLRF